MTRIITETSNIKFLVTSQNYDNFQEFFSTMEIPMDRYSNIQVLMNQFSQNLKKIVVPLFTPEQAAMMLLKLDSDSHLINSSSKVLMQHPVLQYEYTPYQINEIYMLL